MKHLKYRSSFSRICCTALTFGICTLMVGCDEVNLAIDHILGKQPPVVFASSATTPSAAVVPAKKRQAGEVPLPPAPQVPAAPVGETKPASEKEPPKGQAPAAAAEKPAPVVEQKPTPPAPVPVADLKGKKRAPGELAPVEKKPAPARPAGVPEQPPAPKVPFVVTRDPFKAPTEILPSECPPSMPLCKFDRSQLKLVGVIQLESGQFKAMVEDPDGRGYFITPGMQIGGATVTQVNTKGITLHLHKTGQDVPMPLFLEAKEPGES